MLLLYPFLSLVLFLLGEFHGQRSLVGYSLWGCKESDMTEQLTFYMYTLFPFKNLSAYLCLYMQNDMFYSTLLSILTILPFIVVSRLCAFKSYCCHWLHINHLDVYLSQVHFVSIFLFGIISFISTVEMLPKPLCCVFSGVALLFTTGSLTYYA